MAAVLLPHLRGDPPQPLPREEQLVGCRLPSAIPAPGAVAFLEVSRQQSEVATPPRQGEVSPAHAQKQPPCTPVEPGQHVRVLYAQGSRSVGRIEGRTLCLEVAVLEVRVQARSRNL
mmetsp:Transcript_44937/g.82059  ORF Transcript_44937/g.82059 Transcript_44937/m.82059 type:complete len:117 (-) Transcript_44937:1676-2026(-)